MYDIFFPLEISRRGRHRLYRESLDKRFIVGPVYGGDGSTPSTGRQGKTGEANVGQAHGKYYEASSRGSIAFAADQAAGVATTTAISTTAMLSLYNPTTSKTRLSILKVSLGYFSGTIGAGTIYHCVNPILSGIANPTAPASGTSLTSYFSDIFNPQLGTPLGVVKTGSTVVAPIVYRPLCSLNAILASTATGIFTMIDDLDGEITLEPGGCYQIQSKCAAGSTPLVSLGIVWEEIPFVASMG